MTSLILPHRRRSSSRFAEAMSDVGGEHRFRTQAAMTAGFARVVKEVSVQSGLRPSQIIDGVLTVLVSAVQASAPPSEWNEAGRILSGALQERLTVTDDR